MWHIWMQKLAASSSSFCPFYLCLWPDHVVQRVSCWTPCSCLAEKTCERALFVLFPSQGLLGTASEHSSLGCVLWYHHTGFWKILALLGKWHSWNGAILHHDDQPVSFSKWIAFKTRLHFSLKNCVVLGPPPHPQFWGTVKWKRPSLRMCRMPFTGRAWEVWGLEMRGALVGYNAI